MATKNDDQPGGKRRQRSRKPDRRAAKGDQPQGSVSRRNGQEDQTNPMVASTDVAATDRAGPAEALASDRVEPVADLAIGAAEPLKKVLENDVVEPAELLADSAAQTAQASANGAAKRSEIPLTGEVIPPDASSAGAARPMEGFPVTVQAIATAYGEYARRSFQENRSFVERLMGVRSIEQAIEIQTEFARVAYANFVTESQKICELYGELARQIVRPFGVAAMITQFRRQVS